MKRIALGIALGATLLQTSGCVAWRMQSAPPAQVLANPELSVVRVTTHDSTVVTVYQPRVVHDTLTGLPTEQAVAHVNIAVSDITGVATRYKHFGKTVLAGLAIVGGVAVYALLQTLNQTAY
jgi:hypothetical protein